MECPILYYIYTDCGDLTDDSGAFNFPEYPLQNTDNANCKWSITVTSGLVIQLNFTDFHVEPSSDCRRDSVQVFDPSVAKNGGLFGK